MFVIFEGPDLAGKTTLASAVTDLCKNTLLDSDTFDVHTHKRGPLAPSQHPLDEYLVPLAESFRESMNNPRRVDIVDRWHVGEMVYGPLLRGKSRLTMPQAQYIELILNRIGTLRYHVTASNKTLRDRFAQRGDDLVRDSQIETIWHAYQKLMTFDFPHYGTLTTDSSAQDGNGVDNSDYVHKQISYAAHANTLRSELPEQYIGGVFPQVLLVGDRHGDNAPQSMSETARRVLSPEVADYVPWPFGPWEGTSGEWLFDSLVRVATPIRHVGIVNGNEITPKQLRELWEFLAAPRVVALGGAAKRAVQNAKIPSHIIHTVAHPSYMRRFKNGEKHAYGMSIKRVMPTFQTVS